MYKPMLIPRILIPLLLTAALTGCTVHPAGEKAERQDVLAAGEIYRQRDLSPLPDHPTVDDLIRYALRANGDVEQKYWQWRAAIEQVPIDGTQASSLAVSIGATSNEGNFDLDRTSVTVSNDPMTDLVLPGKLSAAAQRSLENARAAGWRFRKTQFELRGKVLAAYADYALNAELIRLERKNIELLADSATITQSRGQSGLTGQQDVLMARNDVDLARNDVENMQSQLPAELAMLNALLNRPAAAEIPIPDALPPSTPLAVSDQDLLDRAARANPELIALADEIRAGHEDIHLARLQYDPDFDLAASTDLKGIAQALLAEFTIPAVRHEALHAAVEQAQADLRAAEAMRRQTVNDLAAQLLDDLATLHDADRQIDLLDHVVLPRARQAVTLTRSGYQTSNASLLDLLQSQRSLIDIQRLEANLRVTRIKRMAEIETITAAGL